MNKAYRATSTALLLAAGLMAAAAQAASPINTKSGLFGDNGIAIRGYDPVAYFIDGKPEKGADQFSYQWKGATWKFASQDHLDKFKAMPEHYAPQYGGYCAYGVAKDNLVGIDPSAWTVRNDKLYLNYDEDIQKKWTADPDGYIQKADTKFDSLLKK